MPLRLRPFLTIHNPQRASATPTPRARAAPGRRTFSSKIIAASRNISGTFMMPTATCTALSPQQQRAQFGRT